MIEETGLVPLVVVGDLTVGRSVSVGRRNVGRLFELSTVWDVSEFSLGTAASGTSILELL